MEENVQIRCFTVGDVRNWLVHNCPPEGLSEKVIAKQRAWAIIHNPYATDDMDIISAIYVNEELAAFTCIFPDKLQADGELIFWYTTLWCEPRFEGRGFAYCVMAQLIETHGNVCYDLDGAPATVETLNYIGLSLAYREQYILKNKDIRKTTLKGKVAAWYEKMQLSLHSRACILEGEIAQQNYTLEYVSHIDDATYAFIVKNAENDVFLRSQAMLNWIIQYSFMQSSPLCNRVPKDAQFSSTVPERSMYAVRVLQDGQLVGLYILKRGGTELNVVYLYYESSAEKAVFYSVAEHLLHFNTKHFITMNRSMATFIDSYHLVSKLEVYNKSFSYPANFAYDKLKNIHAGDGDNMA